MKLRVGTFNIRNGYDVHYDYDIIAQDIIDLGIDVCGFQEVDLFTDRNGKRDTMKLLGEKTGYDYYFNKSVCLAGGDYGTGVLSRFPIVSYKRVELSTVGIEDCVDKEIRAMGILHLDANREDIVFINTHLTYIRGAMQTNQFADVAAEFASHKRVILTGDFNTPYFDDFKVIKNCKLANNENNVYNSYDHRSPIDNIVVPDSAEIIKTGLLTTEPDHSDHRLLWADIEI